MSKMEAHATKEDGQHICLIHPASPTSVSLVLSKDENDDDGRSNWVWVRLSNGDLILGVFPQGDTYCEVEADAMYPGDSN
jgi:hypothetical protein